MWAPLSWWSRRSLWYRWPNLSEQVHVKGGSLQSGNRTLPFRALQQYLSSQGKLPSFLWLRSFRWTGLRKRWKCLQVHLPDEAAHLRVSDDIALPDCQYKSNFARLQANKFTFHCIFHDSWSARFSCRGAHQIQTLRRFIKSLFVRKSNSFYISLIFFQET